MSEGFACSHCGEMLPANAKFCRHCGASDEYGWDRDDPWSETDADDDEAGYGEDDFDYDDFVAREFPEQADQNHARIRARGGTLWLILVICGMLILAAVYAAMSGQF